MDDDKDEALAQLADTAEMKNDLLEIAYLIRGNDIAMGKIMRLVKRIHERENALLDRF